MFRSQAKSESFKDNVNDLLLDGWTPGLDGTSDGGWGKRDDHRDVMGPEICWDPDGNTQPLALMEMSAEEKEVNHSLLYNFTTNHC